MELKDFVSRLKSMNFSLAYENDKLSLKADSKKVTKSQIDELKRNQEITDFIKSNKQALIDFISRDGEQPSQIQGIYRLSGLQEGMMFHSLYDQQAATYIEQFACDLIELDATTFEQAWQDIIQRHTILRTSFSYDKLKLPVQCVHSHVSFNADLLDFSALSEGEKHERLLGFELEDRAKKFDLEKAPLMRLTLIKTGPERHRMIWTCHHILFDGWSLPIIMSELFEFYQLRMSGEFPVSDFEDRYEDYIRYIEKQDKTNEEAHWKQYLRGVNGGTLLALIDDDLQRNKGVGVYKESVLSLTGPFTKEIEDFAQKSRITVNTLMQGVWAILLHHYNQTQDVIFGVTVSGRPEDLPNIENRVGLYINTIPLRSTIVENQNIAQWLQNLQDEQVQSRKYQYSALNNIQKWADIQRDLFDSIFVFENYPVSEKLASSNLSVGIENATTYDQTNYPLGIKVVAAGRITVTFNYNATLLADSYVENMLLHYENVLRQIISAEKTILGELELITSAEREMIVDGYNQTKFDFPDSESLVSLFEKQVRTSTLKTALAFEQEEVSYQRLNQRVNQLCHFLVKQGISSGARVAICQERGLDMVISILAILKAGAAYVPIDPECPIERLSFILDDALASFLITNQQRLSKYSFSGNCQVFRIDLAQTALWEMPMENPGILIDTKSLAYIIYTSGSSGQPKGVLVSHDSVVNLVLNQKDVLMLRAGISVLQFASLGFDASVHEIFCTLLYGGKLVLCSKNAILDRALFKELIERHQIELVTLPPSYQAEVKNELHSVKTLISAGEMLNKKLAEELSGKGIRVINAYGPTENTVSSVLTDRPVLANGKVVIGKPIGNVRAFILDENFRPVPHGVKAELFLGGKSLANGYLNLEDLSAEKFSVHSIGNFGPERLYRTGDLARWLPGGDIEYIGRKDDQLKIRGNRVELGEIEAVLQSAPGILHASVVYKRKEVAEGRLIGYIICQDEFDRAAIASYLEARLPDYMVPATFVVMDAFPLTSSGKVDKKALPEPEQDSTKKNWKAGSQTESKLAQIWTELLEVPEVSGSDDFFDLGGHSLLGIRLIAAIRSELSTEVTIGEVFANATLELLAEVIDGKQRKDYSIPALGANRPDLVRLSYSQERLWFIDKLAGSKQYHMPWVVDLKGHLDIVALEMALRNILERHQVLRTQIVEADGIGYQRVMPSSEWGMQFVSKDQVRKEGLDIDALIESVIQTPFQLQKDYLFRATLFEREVDKYVLVLLLHHIAFDGGSIAILASELSSFYKEYRHGRKPTIAPLPIQYADFALWERKRLAELGFDSKIDFWKSYLAGSERLKLLSDFRYRPQVGMRGSVEHQLFDVGTLQRLKNSAQEHGVTLFVYLLSAFYTLLHRYSGQTDICVGTSTGGRFAKELEGLIGFFSNTLALRNTINRQSSFKDILDSVKENTIRVFKNQDVPFEKVVEAFALPRDLAESPFFQVLIVLQDENNTEPLTIDGLNVQPLGVKEIYSKFDLTLSLSETAHGLAASLVYRNELFSAETIAGMLSSYGKILSSTLIDASVLVGDIVLIDSFERERLVNGFNVSSSVYPADETILDLFAGQVKADISSIALVFEGQTMSYGELDAASNRLGHYLRGLGVGPESLVGICLERGMDMIVSILGILKSGGAYVPIDPDYPSERISYMVNDSGVSYVVSSAGLSERLPATCQVIELDGADQERIGACSSEAVASGVVSSNLAYVIYTSGSTGRPKGVMVEHGNLMDYIYGLDKETGISSCESYGLISAAYTDLGNTVLYSFLAWGGTLHVFSASLANDAAGAYRYFQQHRIDCLKIVPSHWEALSFGDELILPSKLLVFGGEALSYRVLGRILESGSPCQVVNHYGPTETTVGKLLHMIKPDGGYEQKGIPIGRPFSNTRVYVLDAGGKVSATGVAGELYIGGKGVARGYLNRADLTSERFIESPFQPGERLYRTGDLVRWLPEGNIEYLGRVDDQVKIRGYRVELGEIERVMSSIEGVGQSVVVLREDSMGQKRLAGYYLVSRLSREKVSERLRELLPDYMVPSSLTELDSFPLTGNGKIDKRSLPEPENMAVADKSHIAPQGAIAVGLVGILEELLEVSGIGMGDNFFELGGHSLLAIRLISAIRKELGIEVTIGAVFDNSTIGDLCSHLASGLERSILPSVVRADRPDRIPLSYSQERLWFIDQLEGSVQYHVPAVLRLTGDLDVAGLESSLRGIVNRHEVLRSVILEDEGQAYQQVLAADGWSLSRHDVSGLEGQGLQSYIEGLIGRRFDLSSDHMLRCDLLQAAEGEYILVLVLHHIASDGWSTGIIISELVELYDAYLAGRAAVLPELGVQYADYALWQRSYLSGPVLEEKLSYWQGQLTGAETLNLPTDYVRPAVQSTRGALLSFELGSDLSAGLQSLSQQHGVTLFMTLLSAFKVLLSRYSGQSDICVGSPVAGRMQQEVEGLVGFFINTLALRSDLSGDPSFTELLGRVRETTLSAYEHQDVPFEKVVERVVKHRDMSRSPLFSVMFVFQNTPDSAALDLGGQISFSPVDFEHNKSTFDISLSITETVEGIKAHIEYCTDLYTEQTIDRLFGHYRRLLESVLASPGQPVSRLEMLSGAEHEQLLTGFNQTGRDYDLSRTVLDLFAGQVKENGSSVALVFEGQTMSYGELDEASNRLGHYLRGLGVGPESLVGICLERGMDMVVAILGILKSGGAYVPIDPDYPIDRISYMLTDSGASYVVSSESLSDRLAGLVQVIQVDGMERELIGASSSETVASGVVSTNLAYVIYTSGSTGRPKGVMVEHGNLVNFLHSMGGTLAFDAGSTFLSVTTYSFDIFGLECMLPLISGGRLLLASRETAQDGVALSALLRAGGATHMQATPAGWQVLVDAHWRNTGAVKMVVGGEALGESLKESLCTQGELWNMYGPTETTIWSTERLMLPGQPVTIGAPIGNTRIYILNSSGGLCPVGVSGELYIGGSGVARGYLNRADLTAERFIASPFASGERLYRTGDLGRWLADGNIEYVGRMDDQVKVRGYRIELGEIESVLQTAPGVSQGVVVARADGSGHKRLLGYYVGDGALRDQVHTHLSSQLPDYMVPGVLIALDALPLTPNGKVDRKGLPDPDFEGLVSTGYVAPVTQTEQVLAGIWADLLGLDRVGIHDNFFELGGHSLSATRLVSSVRRQLGTELLIRDLFVHPTVHGLAGHLASGLERSVLPSVVQADRPERIPLSYSQERLWFIDQLEGSVQYHVPAVLRLTGDLDVAGLESSLRGIVNRHEVLRSVILEDEGQAYQQVLAADGWSLSRHDVSGLEGQGLQSYIEGLIGRRFDLSSDHMLRCDLLQAAEGEYILVLVLHHIASDGWSTGIIISELVELYDAYLAGRAAVLPELGVQYADYALWQRSYLSGPVLEEKLSYWQGQLTGAETLNLPTDYVRPAVQSTRGALLSFELGSDLSAGLQSLSQQHGVTLFMTLLSAFKVLLSRYSGQSDICVGSPVAGRMQQEVEGLVGFFINTLALRSDLSGDPSFTELLGRVRETTLSAYEHQDVPFEKVVERVVKHRDMSRSPLFGVLFSLQNAPINSALTTQLVFEPFSIVQTTSQYDLQFSVLEGAASLSIGITYSTDLFEPAMIERLFGHYRSILESIVASVDLPISKLDMLGGTEREQLLLDFNQTGRDYDLSRTVLDLFADRVKEHGSSLALVFEGQTMSYGELDTASNRLGHYLRGLGVGPESLVGICLERGMDMVVAILGILKSGGAYVPIDPDYPLERISYMLTNSRVSCVVSSEALSDRLAGLSDVIQLDGVEHEAIGACSSEAVISGVSSANLAYVIYTSGSTGRPKGVMVEHCNLTNFLLAMNHQVPQTSGDHLLAITSISFDISILELLWPLTKGMGLTIKAKETGLVDFDQYLDTEVNMDFSLFFFSSEADSAERNKYQFLLNAAAFADQNDFSAIWLPERHFHKFGGIFPNPSVLAAAVASKTNKVELRAGSVVLPLHDPIRVAEEWSVVDNLSDGRVSLSIASGWHADDFVLSPESFADRHSIMYSHIDQLQKLWKGGSVTRKNGLGLDIDVKIFPQPVSSELPLWITSAGNEETFRSAGRLGAGILTHILGQNIEILEKNIALYYQTLREFGHAADKGRVALMLHTFVGESSEKVREIVKEPFKRYLASSINLLQNLQRSLSGHGRTEELTSEQLLEVALEKSMESGALFGDAEHCSRLIQNFYRIGVTEIACLIDFGVDSELAVKGLNDLNKLRKKFVRQNDQGEIKKHPISTLQITPSYLSALIEDKGSSQFLRKLDTVLIGGEKLSEELVDRFYQKCKASVYNVYGPTETTIWSTVKKITADDSSVTIGKPIGNTQILILDKANNLCPIGVPGEMYIAGAGVARGYLDQPDKTAERFFSKPNYLKFEGRCYRTGDIVKWLPNGEIQYLGRNDNQIKLRGYRIEPGEIEQAIDAYKGVRQSLVVGTADGLLVAYLVVEAEFNKERLESYLRGKLPEFMVPSVLVEIQEFALTPNGKIDRSLLPVPGEFLVRNQGHVAPKTPIEVALCGFIKELVKVDRVGLNDNFFAIGGHSLLAVRLIAFIRKEFQIELPIKALFIHRTIGDLCSHLASGLERSILPSVVRADRPDRIPLSYSQERLWFIDQLEGSVQYHVPAVLRLTGDLDVAGLESSLRGIVNRHEVLRSVILEDEGQAYQQVLAADGWSLSRHDVSGLEGQVLQSYIEGLIGRRFDLSSDHMLRCDLLQAAEGEYILVLVLHHIASDGWSTGIIISELVELYDAYLAGRAAVLPELGVQYADYALWQRSYLSGPVLEEKLSYWQGQLTGAETLNLPTDYVRPAVQSTRGALLSFELGSDLSAGLQSLSQQHGVTLFMTLLSAFKVLLSRYSGQSDICVGSPVAGRMQQEVEGLVGFFINTLALRSDLSGDPSFTELLGRVRETTLSAYEHQDVPFEKVVERVVKHRDMSRSPLFSVMFVFQNTPDSAALDLGGQISFSPVDFEHNKSTFDISLSITETVEGIKAHIEYCTDLYTEQTIDRLFGHYRRLLESVLASPGQPVSRLEMLSGAEHEQLLTGFNQTGRDYDLSRTVLDLFAGQVKENGSSVALVFEGQTMSYGELDEASNRLGHYLRGLGVGPESLVGICLERGMDMVVAILGILKSGGAYVPIDPDYPIDRISYMLTDSGASYVVSSESLSDRLAGLVQVIQVDGMERELIGASSSKAVISGVASANLAYVIYTSGSTGRPKGVMVEHGNLVNFLHSMGGTLAFDAGSTFLSVTTYSFDIFGLECMLPLISGGRLLLASRETAQDGVALSALLRAGGATHMQATPAGWQVLVDAHWRNTGAVKMVVGGEALGESLKESLCTQGELWNMYGPTETTIWSTERLMLPGQPVTIGAPIGNTRIYILNSSGGLCPVGVSGELYIGGSGVARGYLNRADLTAERFIASPFASGERLYRTGDLGRWLADGNIEYVGRMDDQVKVRGYRIELGEIESVLQTAPGVSQGVVVARADGSGHKRLIGYYVGDGALRDQVHAHLSSQLPDYMVPGVLIALDALPLTPNGKVDRKGLPDPDFEGLVSTGYVAPVTQTEQVLAGIWADLLGLDRVGIHDNFFELGGHSLSATRLVSSVRRQLGTELLIRDLFVHPTVHGLAGHLASGLERSVLPSVVQADRPDRIPLSYSQERLWFIDQLEGSVQYHVPAVLRLTGDLDVAGLESSLRGIVNRHEVLRSVILEDEGQAYQQVLAADGWSLSRHDVSGLEGQVLQSYIEGLIGRRFDLSSDHMLRCDLLQAAEGEYILVLVLHHIASDGWSTGIIISELVELYDAYLAGRAAVLPELGVQYADYALWQRSYLSGPVLEEKLSYWQGQLTGAETLNLPTDYVRPAVQSTRGALLSFELGSDLSAGLQSLSQQHGVTLFMTLLSAFKVLLSRYSGQSDICVGSPVAGRMQQEVEGLVGFFINTLALRSDLSGDPSFTELLGRVRETTLSAYEHQDVPFEKVVERVVKHRDMSRSPLFSVMFVFQNTPDSAALDLGGQISFSPVDFEHNKSIFEMTFFVTESITGLKVSIEYCRDLYTSETIDRLFDHYRRLLESVLISPEIAVSELEMLGFAEREQLVAGFNQTGRDYDVSRTVLDLFVGQVKENGSSAALVFEGKTMSYGELDAASNRLGHYLRGLGVGPESLVGICLERGMDMVVAILGILKSGGAYVPIDPDYPADRISYMLADSGASYVVSSAGLSERLPATCQVIELDGADLESIGASSSETVINGVSSANLAYVIYTSGSTGRPKGVMVEHKNLANLVLWHVQEYRVSKASRATSMAGVGFDAFGWELFPYLSSGASVLLVNNEDRLSLGKLGDLFCQEGITHSFVATAMLWDLVRELSTRSTSLEYLLTGGDRLAGANPGRLGYKLVNNYGPTENTVVASNYILEPESGSYSSPSIGAPIGNTRIYILNSIGGLCPVGVAGELYIGGSGVARGYLNRADLTAERFIASPFVAGDRLYRTGDLGRWLADGNIEYVGRMDDQVKVRGYRIELGEIESVLQTAPGVSQGVVVARADGSGHKRLIGYYVGDGALRDQVHTHLSSQLPDYMVPGVLIALDALPLTPNGKVDRKGLPDPDFEGLVSTGYVAPVTQTEQVLAGIWADLLGLDRVGIHDNFFELGGHSLMAMRIVTGIKIRFDIDVAIKSLFLYPHLRSQADHIDLLKANQIFYDEDVNSIVL